MDFGKLPDLQAADLKLPPDHPETGKFLKHLDVQPAASRKIFLGYTAWTHKEWLGVLYPKEAKSHELLHYYAHQFDCIELNTTFYRIPDFPTVARWKNAVPPGFKFCPKIYQDISHRQNLFQVRELTQMFIKAVSAFGENLGPCFLQLPPSFGPALLPRLENFIHDWPPEIPLAVEFRHEAWFDQNPLAEAGFDLLKQNGVIAVLTDVAGRRDVLHMHITSAFAMLRLVGNSLHPSDFSRSDDWARRLAKWFDRGLKQAFLFLHQPDCSTIPEFGGYLIHTLNRECKTKLKPFSLYNTDAEQTSLF